MIALSFCKFPLYALIAILSFQLVGAGDPVPGPPGAPTQDDPEPTEVTVGPFVVSQEMYDHYCDLVNFQQDPVVCFDIDTVSDELRKSKNVKGYLSGDQKHLVVTMPKLVVLWDTPHYQIELKSHPFESPGSPPLPCTEVYIEPRGGKKVPGFMNCRGRANDRLTI